MNAQVLDMRDIRYLNLFSKITRVRCKNCFSYNNFLIFGVPSAFMSKAIGENGKNVKKLISMIRKRVKIVVIPDNIADSEKFISDIVAPIEFKSLEVNKDEIIISGNRQSKAALIGRNKVRLLELQKIVKEVFGKNLRIV